MNRSWFDDIDWVDVGWATLDTLSMLGGSLLLSVLIGLPLGVLLFLSSAGQLFQHRGLYALLSVFVNVLRSIPFIILMILMIPLTVMLVGTSLGVAGAIPPLVAGTAPFFARLTEISLREVDRGVVEAAQAMGATPSQIVLRVLLREALPGLIAAGTVTAVSIVSYTAMAGAIGAGGLGDLAIRYGYQRFQTEVMVVTVAVLLVLVQLVQMGGDWLVARVSRR